MPPTRVSTASGRKATTRAASVPVIRQENSVLASLRPRKPKPSSVTVEDVPPSSLPAVVITRGRKRGSGSCTTSQAECVASTSCSVAEPIADTSELRPKRRKRSSSTPTAPDSSQLSTQLQSRRRTRSRIGLPIADVEQVLPSRVSARLSRKFHPFISSRSSDIYTHLADPNSMGDLLSEPPVGSVISSTSSEVVGSQSVKQSRGRRRKASCLTDENAKRELMEEWAQMRRSEGPLPLSGINENACFTQMLLCNAQRGGGSVSSTQLEAKTRRSPPDAALMRNDMTTIPQPDVSPEDSFPNRIDFENGSAAGTGASGKKPDRNGSILLSDGGSQQPIVPGVDTEAPSTSFPDHIDKVSPSGELTAVRAHRDGLQCPGTSPLILPTSPRREHPVHVRHLTKLPVDEQTETGTRNNLLRDSHSVTLSQTSSDSSSMHPDSDEGFFMLDVPEIFTLPWVPVASNLYVPPSLGKLISGMREQLTMETRARRRAEELYQAELSRRMFAERMMEDLRTELEERQKDLSAC